MSDHYENYVSRTDRVSPPSRSKPPVNVAMTVMGLASIHAGRCFEPKA